MFFQNLNDDKHRRAYEIRSRYHEKLQDGVFFRHFKGMSPAALIGSHLCSFPQRRKTPFLTCAGNALACADLDHVSDLDQTKIDIALSLSTRIPPFSSNALYLETNHFMGPFNDPSSQLLSAQLVGNLLFFLRVYGYYKLFFYYKIARELFALRGFIISGHAEARRQRGK